MLKAIHSQECKSAAREKAAQAAQKLRERKISSAAKRLEDGIDETLTYMDFPKPALESNPVPIIQLSVSTVKSRDEQKQSVPSRMGRVL